MIEVPNNGGGLSCVVTDWTRLRRFLILGVEGGSYHAGEAKLTIDNAKCVLRCCNADHVRTIYQIVTVSSGGLAPKNDAAIFALAICMKLGSDAARALAHASVNAVCRIPTHLFQLAEAVSGLGGWGRATKRAFANWYLSRPPADVAYNVVKYKNRANWTHRDILRMAKPANVDRASGHGQIFRWIATGGEALIDSDVSALLRASTLIQTATLDETLALIHTYGLPWECVRTELLPEPAIWQGLIAAGALPLTAMLRNLGRMTAIGVFRDEATLSTVVSRLTDPEAVRKSRIHPLNVLVTATTYGEGKGEKGATTWIPNATIVNTLNKTFYLSTKNAPTTNKRMCLAVDVSGSMAWHKCAGLPLSPAAVAAAMALVIKRSEPQAMIFGFSTRLVEIPLSTDDTIDRVQAKMSKISFGGTDCSLPMITAARNGWEVDVFVVLTDNETNANSIPPAEALRRYREKTGIPAKLIVVALEAAEFTIADPDDAGMLDVCGGDASLPTLIAEFAVMEVDNGCNPSSV